ncbi:protein MpCupin93 [Marchantia polymorpha subsp. ruderalis]|uniref:Germin-like protein n=2 Tax=Marchantia polymorpha TaxID=3197 RepID=A0AAF6BLS3_MARPO|nr:hypothetical protein MARPO_0010s0025 [Marchantia polymorpha]BBN12957.1 hypothetical protein Mp_5g24310 [Marchantia polymorpha subsp. ruderalis]|eukprot:PTQ46613.1 hypothetical protein MARPO_0010s0025 [Marchantia polymorpha]
MTRSPIAFGVFLFGLVSTIVFASDPEPTTDFVLPRGVDSAILDGNYFTSTILRNDTMGSGPYSTTTQVSVENFPALQGLGISMSLARYSPGAVVRPQIHPRATELLYVLEGTLDVGFIDSTNKLFRQTLQTGDLWLVPQGMVHFLSNLNDTSEARAVAAFTRSNPGYIDVAASIFGSNERISKQVLSKSFKVYESVIQTLFEAQEQEPISSSVRASP